MLRLFASLLLLLMHCGVTAMIGEQEQFLSLALGKAGPTPNDAFAAAAALPLGGAAVLAATLLKPLKKLQPRHSFSGKGW